MNEPSLTNTYIFRPRSSYLWAGIAFAMTVVTTFQFLLEGDLRGAFSAVMWGFFACTFAYLLFIHPKVTLFDEGIRITNPIFEFTFGWNEIEEIEARYCMSVVAQGKNIYAWAAPAPGRYHSRKVHPSDLKGLKFGNNDLIRPGESPRTHSGVASQLAKIRLANFRTHNSIQKIDSTTRIDKKINKIGIVCLALSLGGSLLLYTFHF